MLWVGGLGILLLNKGYFYFAPSTELLTDDFLLIMLWSSRFAGCRLRLRGKRTSGRNSGSYNGLMHKEHYMDCKRRMPKCSMTELTSPSSIRWPKKPKGELKLQGMNWIRMWRRNCLRFKIEGLSFGCWRICFRLRELHTLKGHVESVVRLKGLDIDTIQQAYTVWQKSLFGNSHCKLMAAIVLVLLLQRKQRFLSILYGTRPQK